MSRLVRGAALLTVLSFAAGPAVVAAPSPADADRITWVRSDGAPGWQASIARETHPAGVSESPLLAPMWFPRLPAVTLTLTSSGTLDLAGTRGRVVLLDFWASWCGPCQMELPHLQRLHQKDSPRGLVTIAVNADEQASIAAAAARRIGLTMPVAVNDTKLYGAFGVHTLPTVLLADKEGRVRSRWDGYRPGLENTIAEAVSKLIADDSEGTQVELASVLSGRAVLRGEWSRELPGTLEGVVVLPAAAGERSRVVAAIGGMIVGFDRRGEMTARTQAPPWAGRVIDFGAAPGGSREIVGFRRGGTTLGVIDLRTGSARSIEAPAPLVDVAVDGISGAGTGKRIAMATLAGPAIGNPSGGVTMLGDKASGRDIASRAEGGFLTLAEDGSIAPVASAGTRWPAGVPGAERLVVAEGDGVVAGPRTVIASTSGRFLPGHGRQIAVATYSGHVVLLDARDGTLMFDAVWADVRDLASGDLDGDGLDELVVAAGRKVAALSAAIAPDDGRR
jgi:thiol-disulfide isomerase/thioredoxin